MQPHIKCIRISKSVAKRKFFSDDQAWQNPFVVQGLFYFDPSTTVDLLLTADDGTHTVLQRLSAA